MKTFIGFLATVGTLSILIIVTILFVEMFPKEEECNTYQAICFFIYTLISIIVGYSVCDYIEKLEKKK